MEPGSPQSTISTNEESRPERDVSTLEINREILKEIAALYTGPDDVQKPTMKRGGTARCPPAASVKSPEALGLQAIGRHMGLNIGLTHKKAVVMIIGNISAGKSTFINWFIQEAVQKTGMAIETSGFTFVTSGRCLNEIGGESTLTLRPYLVPLTKKYRGFTENLSLKTCPSIGGRLQLLDLVDTPGLADGELQYPFDVEEVIVEMRDFVDLFVVFFDPIGQALGKRMLSVAQRLHERCPDKLRFCLSKVDEIRTEEERIKVMCQTTQSLTARINSRHGFDLIPIYVPGAKDGTYLSLHKRGPLAEKTQIVNRIHDLTADIEKTTERRVQDSLNRLLKDVTFLTTAVETRLQEYEERQQRIKEHRATSQRRLFCRIIIYALGLFLAILHLRLEDIAPSIAMNVNYWASQLHPRGIWLLDAAGSTLASFPHGFLTAWGVLALAYLFTMPFARPLKLAPSERQQYTHLLEYAEFLKAAQLRWKQLNTVYMDHSLDDPQKPTSFTERL